MKKLNGKNIISKKIKKIKGYLVKRLSVGNVIALLITIAIITLALIGTALLIKESKRYIYNDGIEQNVTNRCEERKDGLYCSKMIKVEWFMEE